MRILVVSGYCVIREGIINMLLAHDNIFVHHVSKTIREKMSTIKSNIVDTIVLDIHKENEQELDLITEIQALGTNIKIIILDFYGNNELFKRALKCGVQGYIFGKSDEDEIMYAIDQIYKGKKYFDSYFVDCMINDKNNE